MARELPEETVGSPSDTVDVRLVRSRQLDGRPPVLVLRGTTTVDNRSSSAQLVMTDWKAAENLAYEILEEVQQWPGE